MITTGAPSANYTFKFENHCLQNLEATLNHFTYFIILPIFVFELLRFKILFDKIGGGATRKYRKQRKIYMDIASQK